MNKKHKPLGADWAKKEKKQTSYSKEDMIEFGDYISDSSKWFYKIINKNYAILKKKDLIVALFKEWLKLK